MKIKKLQRKDIIISVIKAFGFKSYLEIGLRDKDGVFNHIPCQIKHSVDVDPKSKPSYCGTSDSFFVQSSILNMKWDVIFVDACHLADFVYRDLMNSVTYLNEGGVIFLHDVLPTKYEYTLENADCQTAWKVVPYVLKYHPELRICCITEQSAGMGVIVRGSRDQLLNVNFNPFYEYYLMDANRKLSQNVIQYNELIGWIKNGN